MHDHVKELGDPASGEKKVTRRGMLKVALAVVVGAIGTVAGLAQLKRPGQQPMATSQTWSSGSGPAQTAELVLTNGKIITVDPKDSIAEAVAIGGGKIIKVGTSDELRPLIGQSTEVIDLKGKAVTPGLIDSHTHLGGGYAEMYYLDLRPGKVGSIADIVSMVAKKVQETPKGEWVLGFGWFPNDWPEKRRPNRTDLDPVSPDHPVFLTDMSGWYGWVNTHALKLAGIDEHTPNPLGGVIDRDPTTQMPTGLLVNHSAMALAKKPNPTKQQLEEGIRYAANVFIAEGATSIEDNWVKGADLLLGYQELGERGDPSTRTDIYYHINSEAEAQNALTTLPKLKPFTGMVSLKGWKLQVDGGAATAYTYEPHNGYASTLPSLNPETLKKIVSMLHKSGLQICIHVIGDKALDATLDAIEAALKENPRPDHRHRLEHVVVSPKPGTLERIKKLGVVISTQPTFIYYSGDTWTRLFGEERMRTSVPVKTAIDMGIPVALGADYPCTPDTRPQMTLWSAIMRKTSTGHVIGAQESVDIKQALRLHTMGSAYAAHEENMKGSVEVGKYADLVVWSDDIYSVPTDRIRDLDAELTIVGGQVVHRSSESTVQVVPGSAFLSNHSATTAVHAAM
jgi:predicted amidohydrolase YtcJ